MATGTKFICECGRCGGRGRYDRGTCFECKGSKFVCKARKPRSVPHNVIAKTPEGRFKWTVYSSTKPVAVEIVRQIYLLKGMEIVS